MISSLCWIMMVGAGNARFVCRWEGLDLLCVRDGFSVAPAAEGRENAGSRRLRGVVVQVVFTFRAASHDSSFVRFEQCY